MTIQSTTTPVPGVVHSKFWTFRQFVFAQHYSVLNLSYPFLAVEQIFKEILGGIFIFDVPSFAV